MRCIYNIFLLPTKAFFLPFNTYIGICGVKIFLLYSTKTVNSHPNFYQQKVNVTSYISYALIFNHNFFLFLLQNFVTSILVIFLYTLKIFHSEKYNAFWLTKENQCSTATSHLFIYIRSAAIFFVEIIKRNVKVHSTFIIIVIIIIMFKINVYFLKSRRRIMWENV